MTEAERLFNDIGEDLDGCVKSQLFGKSSFKINKKAFMCFFKGCMVFKLSNGTHQEALSLDGSELFDPSGKGRPMKEWVQVSFDYSSRWREFAIESLVYVKG